MVVTVTYRGDGVDLGPDPAEEGVDGVAPVAQKTSSYIIPKNRSKFGQNLSAPKGANRKSAPTAPASVTPTKAAAAASTSITAGKDMKQLKRMVNDQRRKIAKLTEQKDGLGQHLGEVLLQLDGANDQIKSLRQEKWRDAKASNDVSLLAVHFST